MAPCARLYFLLLIESQNLNTPSGRPLLLTAIHQLPSPLVPI